MSAEIGARSHPVYQRLCDLKKSGNAGRYGLLFSTQFKNYFYYTGTGKVLHIGDYEFKALQAFFDPTISLDAFENRCHQMAGDRLEKFLTTIDSEKLLCAPPVTAMHLASDDNWLEALDSDLQQLVLEVTEACNFRCKYCIYNEDYEGNRDFGTAKMPQEIAQKAIDYLAEHSSSHFAVTFYGGEPLANFPLVRWATEYTLEHYKDKHPTFNLTTNLTLVTDEIADFLARTPGFSVVVSLDGPEEVQNAARVYSANKPTFAEDGRAHKFGVSFPQNKWTKILFCDCGMRFQIEGYDKTANGGKNMRLICARSKMFKKKDAARTLNGIPCPAPYASEWKLELMAREVFRTVWKENAEDILGLLRTLDANLNTTGTPNDGNQLENKLSALNEELDDLVSQRASRSITMDDFLSKSTEINNEIINVEGLLQSSIQEQRPKARLDMHSIEAALSDDASFPDGKIEPGFLDRYTNRIVKSNNHYIWMLQLMNVQQIMPIQSERQPIAMVTYKSGVIEQEQIGKHDKESAEPDCATICRPQDFFLNMSRTKRKRKLVEWLESCQENQVSVLDEKIPLLSFAVDFVTAYEYQKARGIKIHPGLWKDMRVDIFLVKKEN